MPLQSTFVLNFTYVKHKLLHGQKRLSTYKYNLDLWGLKMDVTDDTLAYTRFYYKK